MQLDEQTTQKRGIVRERRRSFDLYYYEQVGSRFYLRITRLGVAVLLLLIVLPLLMILFWWTLSASTPLPKVDVTIKPLPQSASPTNKFVREA